MSATLDELIGRARTQIRDPDGSFILDIDLIAWLNEAITDIAARTEILQHEASSTTSGATIAMPPGTDPEMVQILSLRLGTDDVEFVSDPTWNSWSDEAGTLDHTIARVFDNLIEMYPTPVTGTAYTLRYAKIPAQLSAGNERHELPLQFERKLVEYVVAQAKYKDSEVAEGDRWLGRYEQGLPPVNIGRGTLQPGPLTFLAEPNWFERDPEALL